MTHGKDHTRYFEIGTKLLRTENGKRYNARSQEVTSGSQNGDLEEDPHRGFRISTADELRRTYVNI